MPKLLIVESPNKIKKIESFLGAGWTVAASVGHVRDLPENDTGVGPPDFKPRYVLTERGRGVVNQLATLAAKADEVYLATDPDREGEAIAWHVKEALKLTAPKRVTFQEITASAVTTALKNPRQIDNNLVRAQEARRVADRLVGYMVSRPLSNLGGQVLSAGRVQSVALRLVVDREREIENFKETKHYGARLHFITGNASWCADWKHATAGEERCLDRAQAEQASEAHSATVQKIIKKEVKRAAPPPFTTSTLQQAASVSLKLSPAETMLAAQALFEAGLISYHRTDSMNLSDDAIKDIRMWAAGHGLGEHLPQEPNRWKAKADAQEAHEAIRPTHIEDREGGGAADAAKALYRLIWTRAVASQLKPALSDTTTAELLGDNGLAYIARGSVQTYPGWLALVDKDAAEEEAETDAEHAADNQALPPLVESGQHQVERAEVLNLKTKSPVRYTEASLVKRLEVEGIGRPSTYAAILENISWRGYVVQEKRKLQATTLGKFIVDTLVGRFTFMELGFTRDMETTLDAIAAGKADYCATAATLYETLARELPALGQATPAPSEHTCPNCGKPERLKDGQYGKFWGCSGWPDCKTIMDNVKGKPAAKPVVEQPAGVAVACSACGKPMKRRKAERKNGRKIMVNYFWGCSGWPECKHTLPDKNGKPGTDRQQTATGQLG